ncbi:MAG: MAPEG family protein [Pseudomonadota bacterium]
MNDTTATLLNDPTVRFLLPVLVLAIWTMIMWFWMYLTRIPAFQKAGIQPNDARHPGSYGDQLPSNVRAVADNYNHLHEAPTVFYAVMMFAALTGGGDHIAAYLAWMYVGLRIAHSLVQVLSSNVTLRFLVFGLSSFGLFALIIKEAVRVFI